MRRPPRALAVVSLAAAVIAGLALAPRRAAQPPVKRVLIIHGGPEAFPGNPAFDAAIARSLFSHPTIQVEALLRVPGERGICARRRTRRCANPSASSSAIVHLDVVIANTAPALQFVLRHRDELFPDVPVVFAAATVPPGRAAAARFPASPASCANRRRSKRWTWR